MSWCGNWIVRPFAGVCLALFLVPATGAEDKVEDPDEARLRQAKVGTDNTSIVAYLRSKSATDGELLKLEKLIGQLGSGTFKQREQAEEKLVRLGLVSFSHLRIALSSGDLEIRRRAKSCLEQLAKETSVSVPLSAVRVLLRKRAPGTVEALLRYLPYAGDEEVEREIYFGLEKLVKDRPVLDRALMAGLQDAVPERRALAACLVARRGTSEEREQVKALFNDAAPLVRLRAAQGLLAEGDTRGLRCLIC